MNKQTKTKERIKDFGEVYTNDREINSMIELIPSLKELNSKVLEPTCGNGNFIINILKQRPISTENLFIMNLQGVYGFDILEDNIKETKARIKNLFKSLFPSSDENKIESILDNNFKTNNFLQMDVSQLKNIDIVIGNPPYQENDNGFGSSATPIYNLFIDKIIKEIEPDFFSFIIPSRWLTGGKGLKSFRENMLKDKRIKTLIDYKNDKECFPTVSIEGGVCYFLWDKNYNGDCNYIEMENGEIKTYEDRILNEFDIFIRDNKGYKILKKIEEKRKELNIDKFSKYIKRPTFGFNTNFSNFKEKDEENCIPLYGNQLLTTKNKRNRNEPIGFVSKKQIKGDISKIDGYKVLVAKARGGIAKDKKILSQPILTKENSVCSQTFVVLYSTKEKKEAEKIKLFIETKLFRFLVSLRKLTQDLSISVYDFIPDINKLIELEPNLNIIDKELYKFFKLSEDDIIYIENRIDLF